MSNWKIIVPQATTNMTYNPSAEGTGDFSGFSGATVTRVTTESFYGRYSYEVAVASDTGDGIQCDSLLTVTSGTYVNVSFMVKTAYSVTYEIDYHGGTAAATETFDFKNGWKLYTSRFSVLSSTNQLVIKVEGDAAAVAYIDGVQLETGATWTTFCDGSRDGCEWNGEKHASSSTRSGESRAGGILYDLKDDYSFGVVDIISTGTTAQSVYTNSYAIIPGAQLNSIKEQERVITLVGILWGVNSDCDINEARQNLINVLAYDAYPQDARGWQPVRLWYTGADVVKEILVHYEGGLEANIAPENRIHEKLSLRLRAPDPYWYSIQEISYDLEPYDTATTRYIAGKLRSAGEWGTLGLSLNPTTNGTVYVILYNPNDRKLYVGGNFTGWGGFAGRDYIARYNFETAAWETVGGASDFNGIVHALAVGPDGVLYAGGAFTNAGGDANADYIAQLDTPGAANWNALPTGGGGSGSVFALAIAVTGLVGTTTTTSDYEVYFGGNFTSWNSVAGLDYIGKYYAGGTVNGYAAIVSGANAAITALAHGSGRLYATGSFTSIGGVSANYVAYIEGASPWVAMSSGLAGGTTSGRALQIDPRGFVYVGGEFTTAGGVASANIALWDGVKWVALASGVSYEVRGLAIAPDGDVIAVGIDAGGDQPFKIWNGSEFVPLDTQKATTPASYAVETDNGDPVVKTNYGIFIGYDSPNNQLSAGLTTVNHAGTANAKPVFYVNHADVYAANLYSIRNETTGLQLYSESGIYQSETFEIDLRIGSFYTGSDWRGSIPGMLLPSSDVGNFSLLPGDNAISLYVDGDDIDAWCIFRETYKSYD